MFAYEASHYDAGKDTLGNDIVGFDSTHRPCSVGGQLPWNNVKKEAAETACESIGDRQWRLCTAAEWAYACNSATIPAHPDGGATTYPFPYGSTYGKTTCNGYDKGFSAPITAGAVVSCAADFGAAGKVYDMSGNVKEWVATTLATTTPFRPTARSRCAAALTTSPASSTTPAERRP